MSIRGTRAGRLRAAAIVAVVIAIVSIAIFDLPALAKGSADSSDPFALVLGSFATDVLALIAAYGAFRRQRWGVIVLVVVVSFWAFQAAAELIDGDAALGGIMLGVSLMCLWCCLAPDKASQDDPNQVIPNTMSNRTP